MYVKGWGFPYVNSFLYVKYTFKGAYFSIPLYHMYTIQVAIKKLIKNKSQDSQLFPYLGWIGVILVKFLHRKKSKNPKLLKTEVLIKSGGTKEHM